MSVELFELSRIIRTRRVGWNKWGYIPCRETLLVWGERLHPSWEIASRNIDRACRRWLRPKETQNNADVGPIAFVDGAILRPPPDDRDVPELPAGALPPYFLFGSSESSSDADAFPGHSERASGGLTPRGAENRTPLLLNVLALIRKKR